MTQLSFDERGTPLIDATFVVVDLETSGLDPTTSAITEFGAVKISGGEVIGEFASFVNIDTALPAHITAITGITDQMLSSAPPLTAVLPQFLSFAANTPLIAHNVPFDLSFLRAAVLQVYGEPFSPQTLDTVRLARRLLGDEVRNFRLGTLARRFGSPITPDHRALTDARATVHVFHALVERAAGFGATTVEDLIALTRSHSTPQARRKSLIADAPHAPGVYRFLGHDGETLYVGKATDLKQRLRSYFGTDQRRRIGALVRETGTVTWDVTPTVLDAEVRELQAILREQPRFNVRHRRGERPIDVVLTRDAFPRFKLVTHDPSGMQPHRLGPFTSHASASRFVDAVTDLTGLRDCTMPIRRAQNHPACIRKDVGKCPAPCDGTVDHDGYLPTVTAVATMLTDPSALLVGIRQRMSQRAKSCRFEEASELRDTLHHVAFALNRTRTVAALRAAGTVLALRVTPTGCETVLCRHGALLATATHAVALDDAAALVWAKQHDLPTVHAPSADETMLVARWLFAADTRVINTTGELSLPYAGGKLLNDTLHEGRDVRRVQQHARRSVETLAASNV